MDWHSPIVKRRTKSAQPTVIHWNRIANEIFPVDVGPILDSRAMSILHAAIHDAVNGIERRYEPYTADLSFPGASIEAAVAAAAREVMIAMAPSQRNRIEQEYAAALAEVKDGPAKDQGVTLGQQAARANLDRRADDGIVAGPWPPQEGPITEPVYVPTGKPGDYDFTPPFDAPPLGPIALFPGWGRLTPFVIDVARHRLEGPDPLPSKRYAHDVNFLKAYGSLTGSTRTPDQTSTAFFWFEPFAIWNDIATTVIERERIDPWKAARVLALMNFALADAGIACFDAKYHFRFWRPYTAIRRAGEDENDDTEARPGMAAAPLDAAGPAAAVPHSADSRLSVSGGHDVGGRCRGVDGAPRRFGAFRRHERDLARRPATLHQLRRMRRTKPGCRGCIGGIHFVHAVEDGWAAGKSVGREVSRKLPRSQR